MIWTNWIKNLIKNIYILDSEFEVCLFFFETVNWMLLKNFHLLLKKEAQNSQNASSKTFLYSIKKKIWITENFQWFIYI